MWLQHLIWILPSENYAMGQAYQNLDECLAYCQLEIDRAPDKMDMFVTTSRLYKRHLAEHFCKLPKRTVVLELGVYHGHSTAVLAALFQQVISVDVEKDYLSIAAKHTANRSNIAFLAVNLMAGSWQMFASSGIQVVVIDADHRYEYVRADAHNALTHLPQLEYVVFDDFGHEIGVQRVVLELQAQGALLDCRGIGNGWNGSRWEFRNWNEQTGEIFMSWTNMSEGVICKRGNISSSGFPQRFLDQRFYIYKQPLGQLCPAGILRLLPGGGLVTSLWGHGTWTEAADDSHLRNQHRDALLLELPGMTPGPIELLFNSPRSAFVLSQVGMVGTDWFGIREHLVFEPFQLATRQFDDG